MSFLEIFSRNLHYFSTLLPSKTAVLLVFRRFTCYPLFYLTDKIFHLFKVKNIFHEQPILGRGV